MNLSETFNFGFAQPQLALVMENGSVWDISSNDQFKTIEKNLQIQLPKSRNYHTFSTNNRVLNFVKDDISSNVIQYGKSLNNQNHIKIKKSSVQFKNKNNDGFSEFSESTDVNLFSGLSFKHGIQVGSMFWLVSGEYCDHNPMDPHPMSKSSTMLWFSNKQRWRRGPDLQLSPESFTNLCWSSLNSTAVLFVFIGHTNTFVTKVAIFNFQYKVWTDIPKMKEKLLDAFMTCTMTTLFDKQARPRVVVVFNQLVPNAFSKGLNTLYSVDLNLNHDASWRQESTWFQFQDQDIGMYLITGKEGHVHFCKRRGADGFFSIPHQLQFATFTFHLFWVNTPLCQGRAALLCSKIARQISHENE